MIVSEFAKDAVIYIISYESLFKSEEGGVAQVYLRLRIKVIRVLYLIDNLLDWYKLRVII